MAKPRRAGKDYLRLKLPNHDPVTKATHYLSAAGVQCIEVIEALGLSFHLGNAFKYIWRAGKKGLALEDLKKAQFYLSRDIANRERAAGVQKPAVKRRASKRR